MCNCGCQQKQSPGVSPAPEENKNYICNQCNTFKESPAAAPPPECCGKKMQEME